MPFTEDTPIATKAPNESLALMLGGGGARGAYQAGVLRGIAKRFPTLRLPILTGISAGAVNTTFLAAQPRPLPEATEQLARLWLSLTPDQVYNVRALPLLLFMLQLLPDFVHVQRDPTLLITTVDGVTMVNPLLAWLEEGR